MTPDSSPLPYLVVGSGPAGLSCAYALLKKGHPVCMVDHAPLNLGIPKLVDDKKLYGAFFENNPDRLKPNYGSLNPYDFSFGLKKTNSSIFSSAITGGFSEVWGRVFLPYKNDDLESWPLREEDLRHAYEVVSREVLQIHSCAYESQEFSHYSPTYEILPTGAKLRTKLKRMRDFDWSSKKMYFEQTRIACNKNAKTCIQCGDCIAGCPEDILFSTRVFLKKLFEFPHFKFIPDTEVLKYAEQPDQIKVYCRKSKTQTEEIISAKKIFLGGGVLPTFKIISESMAQDKPIKKIVKDSQYYIFPFLTFSSWIPRDEKYHSLCQWIMGIRDGKISKHRIHIQFYLYNKVYGEQLLRQLGFLYPLLKPMMHFIERHLGIMQIFLHSDDSPDLKIENNGGKLSIEGQGVSPISSWALFRKLLNLLGFGLIPLYLPSRKLPGASFHSGGTFPMRQDPQFLETNTQGRLAGFNRVYVVDASNFPSIPGTTITYTIMANAYRIGSQVP